MSHARAFFMHMYNFILYLIDIDLCLVLFFLVSLSPSLSIQLVCSMAPKKNKSTLSQNPLRSRASTSDSTPFHIRFHDDKARTDFSENFSRRDIHSERQVCLIEFFQY